MAPPPPSLTLLSRYARLLMLIELQQAASCHAPCSLTDHASLPPQQTPLSIYLDLTITAIGGKNAPLNSEQPVNEHYRLPACFTPGTVGLNALSPAQSLNLNSVVTIILCLCPNLLPYPLPVGEGHFSAKCFAGSKADSWGHMKDTKPKTCSRGSRPFVV